MQVQIASPSQLQQAARVALANVADGTIRDITAGSPSGRASFREVAASEVWPDVVSFHFQCQYCAQRFSLEAETYHGSGGQWKPC